MTDYAGQIAVDSNRPVEYTNGMVALLYRKGGDDMKGERVPTRATHNTKKRYGKHRVGAVPLTIWEDREFKELLREEAKQVELPKWSLSDHVSKA